MALFPAAADELLEVGTRINLLVVWREVVEQLGRGMDARRCQAGIATTSFGSLGENM